MAFVFAAVMPVVLAAALQAAASQGASPSSDVVPMRDEPFHKLVFENRYAAVYDVQLPVQALMRYHAHPTNHLAIVVGSGTMQNEMLGKKGQENPTGPAGTVVYLGAGPPHRQLNIGKAPVHFVAVEVLAPRGASITKAGSSTAATGAGAGAAATPYTGVGTEQRAAPDNAPGCRVTLEKSDVRVWRCRLAPGDTAPRRPDTGPFVRIAIGAGRWAKAGAGRGQDVAAGAASWHEGDAAVLVRNTGDASLDFVDVEWK